jgi:hypothetical protein
MNVLRNATRDRGLYLCFYRYFFISEEKEMFPFCTDYPRYKTEINIDKTFCGLVPSATAPIACLH